MDRRSYLSPSDVFTPFSRRFGGENARSLAETRSFYNRVTSAHRNSIWSHADAVQNTGAKITEAVQERIELPTYRPLVDALSACQEELLELETAIFTPIEADLA